MKTLLLAISLLISINLFAQKEKEFKKHEFKLIHESSKQYFGSSFGVAYERLFNKKYTFGFEAQKGISYSNEEVKRDFSFTGFYRRYFSKNQNGFFTEAFLMYASYDSKNSINEPNRLFVGIGVGLKFVIEDTITIEYHLGGGIDIIHYASSDPEFAARSGFVLGYRF